MKTENSNFFLFFEPFRKKISEQHFLSKIENGKSPTKFKPTYQFIKKMPIHLQNFSQAKN